MRLLDRIGVPYRVVIEEQEWTDYAATIPKESLLVLDKTYQRIYETCDDLGDTKSKGPGPARNFIWDHARAEGHHWHWVMDDNLRNFYRLNRNLKLQVVDGTALYVMEEFVLRYQNVAMAGPNYEMFTIRREKTTPFRLNTRIYSCNLIRNDAPFRWRGRYNEDTILSLDILKARWCTILFNAFLQDKVATQRISGGNTAEFYAKEGTLAKSQMLARVHPDVAKVVWRFNRWHHYVDYSSFKTTSLIRKAGVTVPDGVNEYGMTLERRR
jgi:hypothetical protein